MKLKPYLKCASPMPRAKRIEPLNKPTSDILRASTTLTDRESKLLKALGTAESQRDAAVAEADALRSACYKSNQCLDAALAALRELVKDCSGQGYVPPSHGNALRLLAAAEGEGQ